MCKINLADDKVVETFTATDNQKNFEQIKSQDISATDDLSILPRNIQAKTKFINRAGVSELINASEKPAAKRFKDTHADIAEEMNALNAATTKFYYCNEELNVVTKVDEYGEPWMVANPFATVLQYTRANYAIASHVSENNVKNLEEFQSQGSPAITSSLHPKTKFINRAGLFELIQASRMPKAQEFKSWVNSDLLPKLCDNGGYSMVKDAPMDIAQSMNAIHSVTNDGKEAAWVKDLSELKQIVALKDQIIAIKDEENKKLTANLQEANQNLKVANQGLLQAFNIVNEARKETAQLANRMADIAQDVIAKPANPQLLHSLAVCSMGGDQYAFIRPQKRSLKRSLNRLAVEDRDIVFKSDYVPNGVNVLNKVKEALPKDKFTARHNKITLLDDMTKDELVDVISSTMTTRQLALAKKRIA
jgi:prophage antirepressor-like protein